MTTTSATYGPNHAEIETFLSLMSTLTREQWRAAVALPLGRAWVAAQDAVWDDNRDAAWDNARKSARDAVWGNAPRDARDSAAQSATWAASALVVRDLISPEDFGILTASMRAAGIDFDTLSA